MAGVAEFERVWGKGFTKPLMVHFTDAAGTEGRDREVRPFVEVSVAEVSEHFIFDNLFLLYADYRCLITAGAATVYSLLNEHILTII